MKRCVITGASQGLGKALAKKYAKEGYSLILISRDLEKLNQVKNEIGDDVEIDLIPYDLTEKPEEIAVKIIEKYQDIELLINNAGMGISGDFFAHEIVEERNLISLNITAVSMLSMVFGKYFLKKNKGIILNISSVGAMLPGAYMASYYASKAYLSSLSYSINLELKGSNVHMIAFNLPRIETDFDLHAKRKGSLKKGKPLSWAVQQIYKKMNSRRGIIHLGLSTKLTNLFTHLLPKALIAKAIGSRLK